MAQSPPHPRQTPAQLFTTHHAHIQLLAHLWHRLPPPVRELWNRPTASSQARGYQYFLDFNLPRIRQPNQLANYHAIPPTNGTLPRPTLISSYFPPYLTAVAELTPNSRPPKYAWYVLTATHIGPTDDDDYLLTRYDQQDAEPPPIFQITLPPGPDYALQLALTIPAKGGHRTTASTRPALENT